MPGLRQHFADSLDERLATATLALERLEDPDFAPEPGVPLPARTFHLFAHSLQGTAPGLGGDRLGELAHGLAQATKCWEEGEVTPESVAQARATLDELRAAADEYRAWVAADRG